MNTGGKKTEARRNPRGKDQWSYVNICEEQGKIHM
jgi:hypothetical protein